MQAIEESCSFISHQRAVLYFNTDLLSLLPEVGDQPAALRWEDKVLACNEVASHFGLTDNMPFKKAVQLCPGLITLGAQHIPAIADLVNKVNRLFRDYSTSLERVNVDECYLDVTFNPQILTVRNGTPRSFVRGSCPCGCSKLLSAARQLGEHIQSNLKTSLLINCRAGTSSSKLVARLAANRASVDQCRLILPDEVRDILQCQHASSVLPQKIASALQTHGIHSTADIRKLSLDDLQGMMSVDDAVMAINAACGVDTSPVVTCDLWRLFYVEYQVREKLCALLLRLSAAAEEDGRVPLALKLSVRKFDAARKKFSKECKTTPCSFLTNCGRVTNDGMARLMTTIMKAFRRLVDITRPFQLTLLGLAFTRFQESPSLVQVPNRSVASCLLRKRELSFEVPVSISYEGSGALVAEPVADNERRESTDTEDIHCEKKAKFDLFIKSKKFHDESMDVCSPSKLRVGDLSLGEEGRSLAREMFQC